MTQFLFPRGCPPEEDLPFDVQAAQVLDWLSAVWVWMLPPHQPWGCKCRPPYLLLVCLFCSVLFSNVGSVDGTQGLLLVQQALLSTEKQSLHSR